MANTSTTSSSFEVVKEVGVQLEAATPTPPPAVLKALGVLIQEEVRMEGNVKAKVYWTYLKSAGQVIWSLIIVLLVFDRLLRVCDRVWLEWWGESVCVLQTYR